MKHDCKNTVAMNFLALSLFLFWCLKMGIWPGSKHFLDKDESNRSNSSHQLSTTHFDDMNIGPAEHSDCNKLSDMEA